MKANDLMTTRVITIRPGETVGQAADLMLRHQISCLPVVNDNDQVVGILTASDFCLRHRFLPLEGNLYTFLGGWATPKSMEGVGTRARSHLIDAVMSHDVVTISEETTVEEMLEVMLHNAVTRLPVVTNGKLVGIITKHDLLKLLAIDSWHPVPT